MRITKALSDNAFAVRIQQSSIFFSGDEAELLMFCDFLIRTETEIQWFLGFGAQLIGPIQLHVIKAEFELLQIFTGHCLDFFLPVSGKICHSPIKTFLDNLVFSAFSVL